MTAYRELRRASHIRTPSVETEQDASHLNVWSYFRGPLQIPSARVNFPNTLNGLMDFSPVHGCPIEVARTSSLVCNLTVVHHSTWPVKMKLATGSWAGLFHSPPPPAPGQKWTSLSVEKGSSTFSILVTGVRYKSLLSARSNP